MQTQHASKVPRIVIVGGGAGGLELATRLGRSVGAAGKSKVALVDCSPTHVWKPLLHEVATGALNTGEDEVNYFAHGCANGYEFEFGCMEALDRARRCIRLGPVYGTDQRLLSGPREVFYDTLVLAVGAKANDFGTPGVDEFAMQLNTREDADRLRQRVLEESFSIGMGDDARRALNIAIVGGGATGVELAAELHYTMRELHQYGSHLAPERVNISVIEGADRILTAAPPALSSYAEEELTRRRIRVMTSHRVAEVLPEGVKLADGSLLPSDITVWAAGVKAPEWLTHLDGLAVNKLNQIKVDRLLRCEGETRIYAIGDCATVPDGDSGRSLPATAQVAHQQAKWLADAVQQQLNGREPQPFSFKPQGMLVSLGKHTAVGSLNSVLGPSRHYRVEGRSAKLIYASLYRMHQAVVHGWLMAILLYCGDKLRGVARPSLKLH